MESEFRYKCEETSKLSNIIPKASGLVFDFDGTLLDTMPRNYASFQLACEEVKLDFPMNQFYELAGMPECAIWKKLIKEQKHIINNLTEDYCISLRKRYLSKLEVDLPMVELIHNVVDIAKKFYGKIPMAVVSSGLRDYVMKGLTDSNLLYLFDTVVTVDEEEIKKNNPELDILFVAARRLGVGKENCIGFEDSDLGLSTIEEAGFLYACDVRQLYMYPRNIEERECDLFSLKKKFGVMW